MLHDLRYAARTLLRSPIVSIAAIASLALGIGANTAFFSLVDRLVLNPLPLRDPDRLVAVFNTGPNARFSSFTYADYVDYRDGTDQVFAQLAAYFDSEFTVGGGVPSEVVAGALVSWNYFEALGISAAHGRTFVAEEGQTPGTHPVVVVGHEFWRTRMNAVPSAVGSSLTINGTAFTVIGVATAGFGGVQLTNTNAMWIPLMMYNEVATGFFAQMKAIDYQVQRSGPGRMSFLSLVGRLRDGVTAERAAVALDLVAGRLASDFPDTNADRGATSVPLRVAALPMGDRDDVLLFLSLLIGAVLLVLFIACANVANLLLVRAERRGREIGIRVALGAGRLRLLRQWLAESLLMAISAGAAGLLIATLILGTLAQFTLPGGVPIASSVELNWLVFGFTAGTSILVGFVFGMAPAVHAMRIDVRSALTSGARAGDRSAALRGALVAAQVAFSVVLVVGAGLFVRSMARATDADLGFLPNGLVMMSVDFGAVGYDSTRALGFYQRLSAEARAIPGVRATTVTDQPPLGGGGLSASTVWTPDSAEALDVEDVLIVNVAPSYFETMEIPLVAGPGLNANGQPNRRLALAVNRAFETRVWGDNASAVGRHFQFSEPKEVEDLEDLAEVVAVVGNTRHSELDDTPLLTYRSVLDNPGALLGWPMTLIARTDGDPTQTLSSLRDIVRRLDPELPVTNAGTFNDRLARVTMPQRMGLVLLSGLGVVALLVATIGVYAAVSYSLAQRRREIGIRVALGATPSRVTGLVVRLGVTPALIGIAAGLLITLFTTRLLQSFLFGITPTDPPTLIATAGLILAVAAGASILPARRGARTDPVQALRDE
jgi:predicted permease